MQDATGSSNAVTPSSIRRALHSRRRTFIILRPVGDEPTAPWPRRAGLHAGHATDKKSGSPWQSIAIRIKLLVARSKERHRSMRRDPGAGLALGAGDLIVRHLLGDLAA